MCGKCSHICALVVQIFYILLSCVYLQTINRTEGFHRALDRLILLTYVRKKLKWSFLIKIVKCDRGGKGDLWCCRNASNYSGNIRIYPRTPSSLNILLCYTDLWLDLWVCHIRVFSDLSGQTAQFERVLIKITFFNILLDSKQNL